MKLEGIMLSEINQAGKDKQFISHRWNLKKKGKETQKKMRFVIIRERKECG